MIVLFPPWWLHFVFCFHHDDCSAFIVMIVLFPQQWLSCFCSDYFSVSTVMIGQFPPWWYLFCFHDCSVFTVMIGQFPPWWYLFCFHGDDCQWQCSRLMIVLFLTSVGLIFFLCADDYLASIVTVKCSVFTVVIVLCPQKWLTCFYSENVPVFIMRMVKLALWCLSTHWAGWMTCWLSVGHVRNFNAVFLDIINVMNAKVSVMVAFS